MKANTKQLEVIRVDPKDVLPLRSLVLRNSIPMSECVLDRDLEADTLHLAIRGDENIPICILTTYPQGYNDLSGQGYQLRGMASHPLYKGKGLGKHLVNYLMQHLETLGVDYIWCNARAVAYSFYEKLGFSYLSDEFEISGIGTHRVMYTLLNKRSAAS